MGATIAGFASGDTIDLLKIAATSASLNKLDQLIVFNGSTRVSTLQLTGAYQGATFTVTSDGDGGSAIALSGAAMVTPATVFAQAMAGVGIAASPAASPANLAADGLPTARLLSHGVR
jgi:hypothetical protein